RLRANDCRPDDTSAARRRIKTTLRQFHTDDARHDSYKFLRGKQITGWASGGVLFAVVLTVPLMSEEHAGEQDAEKKERVMNKQSNGSPASKPNPIQDGIAHAPGGGDALMRLDDVVILLLDHQSGLFQAVKDIPVGELRANTTMLAKLASQLKIPLITTAS